MLVSLNWLKDYVNIPKSITPEELASKLLLHTLEVENVEKQNEKFNNIVVGKILEIKKHPNADRLQIARVEVGATEKEIVCGAPNIKVGQLVPVALIGAVLPNSLIIKPVEIRGVKSDGMLCAEDELGLGEDHSGILILDKNAKVGQNLGKYLKLDDVIFEVDNKSITHRPDLWSHLGIAREISVFLNTKFKEVDLQLPLNSPKKEALKNDSKIKIKVEDQLLCPRYMAAEMIGIKIGPSPLWMQERLIACGMRPINNIVDITNYILLDLGQPMHAFDADQVKAIVVRKAKSGENIITLDNEKRELDNNVLVITDGQTPIAVAGVMGGMHSGVNENTTKIILESANFNHISIRKTAAKLGLRTESSNRYEKSLDPNLCQKALARAIELIKEACPGAELEGEIIDIKKFKLNQEPISLDLNWLENFIGKKVEKKTAIEILTKLGFSVKEERENFLSVIAPTWRATKDISTKEDLAEEIARLIGYNNLKLQMPLVDMAPPEINEERITERKIKNYLSGAPALTEVYNYSFLGEELLKKLGINFSDHIKLANPLSVQHTMLRQSLAPNLFLNIETNQAKFEKIKIFEIGTVFLPIEGNFNKNNSSKDKLPYQEKRLGIVVALNNKEEAFNELKGIISYLGECFNLEIKFYPFKTAPHWSSEDYAAEIKIKNAPIGFINIVNNEAKPKIGLKKETAIAEISLAGFNKAILENAPLKYQENEKFPSVIRDLAIVLNDKICYNIITEEITNFHPLIKKIELFDIYKGDKLGKQKKSLAFHTVYQADKTLTSQEVDKIQKELINHLEKKFDAKIRDF